ncbi:MAG: hypothetical protein L6R36_006977 [Xanthoria steineri]|nr:MAG: hypothetical protein L6R36_006977 [Xanthoria steineri]
MSSNNNLTVFNFTLQNQAGSIASKVILAPASADWQRLIGRFSGGLSPRHRFNHPLLPAVLKPRQQASSSPRYNASAAFEKLTPIHVSDWYGPESTGQDLFQALATMVVTVADSPDKDTVVSTQSVEQRGYRLNVTNVPLQSQVDYLTYRGVSGLCG